MCNITIIYVLFKTQTVNNELPLDLVNEDRSNIIAYKQ